MGTAPRVNKSYNKFKFPKEYPITLVSLPVKVKVKGKMLGRIPFLKYLDFNLIDDTQFLELLIEQYTNTRIDDDGKESVKTQD